MKGGNVKVLLVFPELPDSYWSFKHALSFDHKLSAFLARLDHFGDAARGVGKTASRYEHRVADGRRYRFGQHCFRKRDDGSEGIAGRGSVRRHCIASR